MKKIIIDTMGSDFGFEPIVKGSLKALHEKSDISFVYVGNKDDIEPLIESSGADKSRIEIIHTTEFVADDALPTCVFRSGDNTSMVLALENLKKNDEIVGMISSGNTGALLVGTICRLGLIPGLKAPALATALPCKKDGLVCLVDCGANVECSPEDLKRFALMGNAFMQSLTGNENPKIALMSVGKTRHKGTTLVKTAYELLEKLPINFIGNIEGSDMINSQADVIVTDGFTGNALLKNAEACGMAAISIVEEFADDPKIKELLKEKLHSFFAFNDLGGATFLGTKKTVVKMHGCANADTAYSCVDLVLELNSRNFSDKIAKSIM